MPQVPFRRQKLGYAFLKRAPRLSLCKQLTGFTISGRKKETKQTNQPKKPPTNQNKRDDTCCNSIYCKTWSCCCRHHPSLARLRHFQHRLPPAGAGCRAWKSNTCLKTGPPPGCGRVPLALHSGAKICCQAVASHQALDARSKPLPAPGREGGMKGRGGFPGPC